MRGVRKKVGVAATRTSVWEESSLWLDEYNMRRKSSGKIMTKVRSFLTEVKVRVLIFKFGCT